MKNKPKKITILVIEPERKHQVKISAALSSAFDLRFTSDTLEGLQMAKLHKPKLIICSIDTPKISCFMFATLLHDCNITADIPILIKIKERSSNLRTHSFKQGVDGMISLETNPDEIIAQINNCINIRMKLKRLYKIRAKKPAVYNLKNQTNRIIYNRVKKIVMENIANENLDVTFICNELGISRNALQRKMKSVSGKTVGKYIIFRKLEKAKEMLLHTDMLIYEISEVTGFNSRQSFIKAFKRVFLLTPSAYRTSNNVT